tara:strand:+ start:493 stop:1617 length:1125 start_codon:yes stop_codon:yes gene_type:complete
VIKKKILHILEIDISSDFIQKKLSSLDNLKYNELLKEFFQYKYSWSNTIKNSFKTYDVEIVVGNSYQLQSLWFKEFFSKKKNKFDKNLILKEQINFFKPGVVLFQNIKTFVEMHEFIKQKNIKSIVYDGVGHNLEFVAKNANIIFSCLNSSINYYQQFTNKCLYLPHGFDETINFETKSRDNLIFIGQVSNKDHFNRAIFLDSINNKFKIKLWLGKKPGFLRLLKNIIYNIFLKKNLFLCIKYLFSLNRLYKNNLGNLYGIDMYKELNKSLITINYHIDKVGDEAANMRIFESTGSGICLLTENKKNLKNFFDIDKEVVVFNNTDEAISKIDFFLKNKNSALKIGMKAKEKTLIAHKISDRWKELENFLINHNI